MREAERYWHAQADKDRMQQVERTDLRVKKGTSSSVSIRLQGQHLRVAPIWLARTLGKIALSAGGATQATSLLPTVSILDTVLNTLFIQQPAGTKKRLSAKNRLLLQLPVRCPVVRPISKTPGLRLVLRIHDIVTRGPIRLDPTFIPSPSNLFRIALHDLHIPPSISDDRALTRQ